MAGPGQQGCEQLLCSCLTAELDATCSLWTAVTQPGRTPDPAHTPCIPGSHRCPLLHKEPDISYRQPQLQLAVLRCSGFSSRCFQALRWTLTAASCHTAGGFSTFLSAGKELCVFRPSPVLLWDRTYSNFSSHSKMLISSYPSRAHLKLDFWGIPTAGIMAHLLQVNSQY